MTAAQAAQAEALISGQEQDPISGEFSIEDTLSEKGVEGLKEVASSEVESAIGKIKDLTEIGTSPEVGADKERGALAKAETSAVSALKAAKDQLIEDLGGEIKAVLSPEAAAANVEQAKVDLMAEKKELFLTKTGKELVEEKETLLEEPKARVVEAEAELAAVTPVEVVPEKAPEVLTAEKELMEAKKKAFLGMKEGDIEKARKEIEPAKQSLEAAKAGAAESVPVESQAETPTPTEVMPSAEGLSPEEAKKLGLLGMETDAELDREFNQVLRETGVLPQEAAEAEEEKAEEERAAEMHTINWEALMVDESKKLEAAKIDYEKVNQALNKFHDEHGEVSAPIHKQYIAVLTTQIAMDELTMRHAQNQIEVYRLKKKFEGMSGETGQEIDALLEEIEAKEKISHTLAEEKEAATKQHDALSKDYKHSLQQYGVEEPTEETEDEQDMSGMDTAIPTGASFGGGFTAEAAASEPAPKKGVGAGAKVKKAAGAVGGAVGRTGKAIASGASEAMTGTQKLDASGGEKSESWGNKIAKWAAGLGKG